MSSFSPDRDLFHLNYASNINQSGNVVLSEVLGIIVPTRPDFTKPRGLIPLSGIREAVRQRIRGPTLTTISTI